MKDYLKNIRRYIGHRKIIHPAARIIMENAAGQLLMIRRRDNGRWGLPAGGLEMDETIEQCIRREVREETGLTVGRLQVIGIITNPERETVTYPNRDVVQYFTIEFYSNDFRGSLQVEDVQEIKSVHWVDRSHVAYLPDNERPTFESLAFFRKTGRPLLD